MTGFAPLTRSMALIPNRKHGGAYDGDDNKTTMNDNHHNVDSSGTTGSSKLFVANVFNRFRAPSPKRLFRSNNNNNNNNNDNINNNMNNNKDNEKRDVDNTKSTLKDNYNRIPIRKSNNIQQQQQHDPNDRSRYYRHPNVIQEEEEDDVNDNTKLENVSSFLTVEQILDDAATTVHERCCLSSTTNPDGWCHDNNEIDHHEISTNHNITTSSNQLLNKTNDDRFSPTSIYFFPIQDAMNDPVVIGEGIDYEYSTHDDDVPLEQNNTIYQQLLHVDSIGDESFLEQNRRLEHTNKIPSEPSSSLMMRSSIPKKLQDDEYRIRNLVMASNKRGRSLPHRIRSNISIGSTTSSVAAANNESDEDDYYNSAIIRTGVHKPVGIRRDISNDRLYRTYNNNKTPFTPIVPDQDTLSIDDTFWNDIIQEEPKPRRIVSSILIRTSVVTPQSCLSDSTGGGSGSVLSGQSTSSNKKVAFNDKMQVRYFQRTIEEREEMRKFALTRKKKKKSRKQLKSANKKRKEKMLCKTSSLLETIDDDEETEDKDEEPQDQGFEAIWDGSTIRRTTSSNSSSSSRKDRRGGKRFGGRSSTSMHRCSSFPTKIVADLQLMTVDDTDELPTVRIMHSSLPPISTTTEEHETSLPKSPPSLLHASDHNIKPASSLFLFQGVMNDINGMLQGISLKDAPKQQPQQQKAAVNIRSKSPLKFQRNTSAKLSLVDDSKLVLDSTISGSSDDDDDDIEGGNEYDEFGKIFSNYFYRDPVMSHYDDVHTMDNNNNNEFTTFASSYVHDEAYMGIRSNVINDNDITKRYFTGTKRQSSSNHITSDDEESWLCTALRCG